MKRILFVCHGNICRSVMAEYIMKYLDKKHELVIDSAATSYEEIGNDIYYLAKDTLLKHNIPYEVHRARHIEKSDLDKYDLIIGPTSSRCAYDLNTNNDDPLKCFMDDVLVMHANMGGFPSMSIPIP